MQEPTMIQQLKSMSSKFIFTLATICGITIYLIINSTHTIVFFVISSIISFPLFFKPKYLIWTAFVASSALLVNYLLSDSDYSGFISRAKLIKVTNTTSMGLIVEADGHNIFIRTKEPIDIGDIIKLSGKIEPVVNNSDFDLETYLSSLNVKSQVRFPGHIEIISKSNDIRIAARKYILDGSEWYNKVTPLLLLGIKTHESREIYNMAIQMNIVHLFVISGFHISLFYLLINKILKLIRVSEKYSGWISLIPIFIYLFFLGFPISATRAMLLVSFSVANKSLLKGRFTTISILSFTMALMFLYKPWSVNSLSFIFTYIATYVVVTVNMFEFKSKTSKYLCISVFAFLSNLLIVIHTNHYFSVFGILYGVILSPLFVAVYSLTLFLFPFKEFMEWIDYSFVYILKIFNRTNVLIDVPRFSINYLYLFYGITLSSIIILITWNLYTEKKDFLSTKKLIG